MPSLREVVERGDYEVSELMSTEEKEQLATDKTPFTLTEVKIGEGSDYGGYWECTAEIKGRQRKFNLGFNENRDKGMEALASFTAVEPVTDCILVIKSKRGGNAFLVIEPADTETEPNGGKQSAKR
jgi:hypothetical protein